MHDVGVESPAVQLVRNWVPLRNSSQVVFHKKHYLNLVPLMIFVKLRCDIRH